MKTIIVNKTRHERSHRDHTTSKVCQYRQTVFLYVRKLGGAVENNSVIDIGKHQHWTHMFGDMPSLDLAL